MPPTGYGKILGTVLADSNERVFERHDTEKPGDRNSQLGQCPRIAMRLGGQKSVAVFGRNAATHGRGTDAGRRREARFFLNPRVHWMFCGNPDIKQLTLNQ